MSHESNFPSALEYYNTCIEKWIDFINYKGKGQVKFHLVKIQSKWESCNRKR